MTKEELAAKLTGAKYLLRIDPVLRAQAKAAGLVIVYGASDDLMEFEGAIYDEVGAYEGATVWIDSIGLIPDWEAIDRDALNAKDKLRDYFKREGGGMPIEALWCKEGDYSWTFKTNIPHATFEIVEDGEPYCRGIVFQLADIATARVQP